MIYKAIKLHRTVKRILSIVFGGTFDAVIITVTGNYFCSGHWRAVFQGLVYSSSCAVSSERLLHNSPLHV